MTALMMETVGTFETSVNFYETTPHCIPWETALMMKIATPLKCQSIFTSLHGAVSKMVVVINSPPREPEISVLQLLPYLVFPLPFLSYFP
jgi:hypothetical protein